MWLWYQLASVLAWSGVNVLDSVIVRVHERRPYVIQWHQSFFTLTTLLILVVTQDIASDWAIILIASGVVAYLGDILFFYTLHRVDASVVNIAWAFLALFLSVAGFYFFDEFWTVQQFVGAAMVLAGVCLLSLWHRKVDDPKSLLLLPLLGLLNVPFFLAQKAALFDGESILVAFFWPLVGREILAGSMPMIVPKWRRAALEVLRSQKISFPLLNGTVVAMFFGGVYLTAKAYSLGPVSLNAIVGNTQPFVVLFYAWILWRFAPAFASREVLTRQSVSVKLVSFLIVFGGLALLALTP